jgi:hypothetical protein
MSKLAIQVTSRDLSVKEAGHDVDDEGNDDRSKQVRERRVRQCDPAYGFGRQVCIRHLKRHPDGQRQVYEIQIGGRIAFIEIDGV